MIEKITAWLIELYIKVFAGLWDFLIDNLIEIFDQILKAIVALLSLIPAPDFLTQYSIGSLLSELPSYVWYFAQNFRLGEAFLALGSGFAFRMARKFLTLFQW